MRIRTRLAELERSNGVVDIGDNQLLVTLLARRDALFWPHRHGGDSRLGIIQRQRQYLDGSVGIASKSDGKSNWKPMHEARQRLEPDLPLAATSTGTIAGSAERIAVYRQRAERGEAIFHPLDCELIQAENLRCHA
jgi:hypothetical protein